MADNGQKQGSSLGELFIEFGSKGLPGLVKGLNTVSASFLLAKNAGQQMIQPLANMSKQASQGIVGLEKLNSVTGISVKQLDHLRRWTKLNNLDFNDYIGQVHSLQNALDKMYLGDSQSLQGFSLLGLNPAELNPSKPLEAMEKIGQKIRQIQKSGREEDKHRASIALQLIGLNEELVYTYEKANKQVDKSIDLTDKQRKNLEEQNTAWNKLNDASGQFFQKAIASQEWFTKLIDKSADAIKGLVRFIDANKEKKMDIIINTIHKTGDKLIEDKTPKNTSFNLKFAKNLTRGDFSINKFATVAALKALQFGKDLNEAEKRYQERNNPNSIPKSMKTKNNNISSGTTNKNDNRKFEFHYEITQNVNGDSALDTANDFNNMVKNGFITQSSFNLIANQLGGFSENG